MKHYKINPLFLIDFYKADHRRQYPKGTTMVYSNWTPRSGKRAPGGTDKVVVFGIQYLIKNYLIDLWNENFFNRPKIEVIAEYKEMMDRALGPDAIPIEHIGELHDLGYLPILMKALPEGTRSPFGVPVMTIRNTIPKFYWITNYLETLFSTILWKPMTSATTAYEYWKEFNRHADKTGSFKEFICWQGHDFSMRGMSGIEDAILSGMGHLLMFNGTDTVPAIHAARHFYPTDQFIGGSVAATEHSVQCMHFNEFDGNELQYLDYLLDLYPTGIVSIVCDGFDYWKFLTETLPQRKEHILAREGRVVIRPDSGNPVHIICGEPTIEAPNGLEIENPNEITRKGTYEILYDMFGGEVNEKGYKILNPKIGLIYGDAITIDRQKKILANLEAKGFAVSNLVLGIGSFTYEYVTRDTCGFAMKATYGEIDGVGKDIFKDPQTKSGTTNKKSARGLLQVKDGILKDRCTWEEEAQGDLIPIFENGKLLVEYSLTEIRELVQQSV